MRGNLRRLNPNQSIIREKAGRDIAVVVTIDFVE
jgi:hypothetical protein